MIVATLPRRASSPATATMVVAALATGVVAAQFFVTAVLLQVSPGLLIAVSIAVAALWGSGLNVRRQTAGRYIRNLTILAPASYVCVALFRAWEIGSFALLIPVFGGGALFIMMDVTLILLADSARKEASLVSTIRGALAGGAP